MLYYCLTEEMSSKENSPAIGSFLWVVMLSMIIILSSNVRAKYRGFILEGQLIAPDSVQRQLRSSHKHFGHCYEWPII